MQAKIKAIHNFYDPRKSKKPDTAPYKWICDVEVNGQIQNNVQVIAWQNIEKAKNIYPGFGVGNIYEGDPGSNVYQGVTTTTFSITDVVQELQKSDVSELMDLGNFRESALDAASLTIDVVKKIYEKCKETSVDVQETPFDEAETQRIILKDHLTWDVVQKFFSTILIDMSKKGIK